MIFRNKKGIIQGMFTSLVLAAVSTSAAANWFDGDEGCCNPCERLWYVSGTSSVGHRDEADFRDPGNVNNSLEFHYKTVFGGTLAVGRQIDMFRLELEGSYRQCYLNDVQDVDNVMYLNKSSTFGNLSFLANAYFDFCVNECLKFYLGAGAVVSFVYGPNIKGSGNGGMEKHVDSTKYKYQDTVFAWQIIPGFIVPINDCFDVIFGYRFFATIKPEVAKVDSNSVESKHMAFIHLAEIGIRFKF